MSFVYEPNVLRVKTFNLINNSPIYVSLVPTVEQLQVHLPPPVRRLLPSDSSDAEQPPRPATTAPAPPPTPLSLAAASPPPRAGLPPAHTINI